MNKPLFTLFSSIIALFFLLSVQIVSSKEFETHTICFTQSNSKCDISQNDLLITVNINDHTEGYNGLSDPYYLLKVSKNSQTLFEKEFGRNHISTPRIGRFIDSGKNQSDYSSLLSLQYQDATLFIAFNGVDDFTIETLEQINEAHSNACSSRWTQEFELKEDEYNNVVIDAATQFNAEVSNKTFYCDYNNYITSFFDVYFINPYYKSITYLSNQKIISGYPDGTYRPNDPINRAEFTKIVMNARLRSVSGGQAAFSGSTLSSSSCFPDVQSEWFAPYVCAAKEQGIIGGYPDGSFKPGENVNTAEAAKIVVETFGLDVSRFDCAHRDTSEAQDDTGCNWYDVYLDALNAVDALPPSAQEPSHLLTRGEMAEVIYKVMTSLEP